MSSVTTQKVKSKSKAKAKAKAKSNGNKSQQGNKGIIKVKRSRQLSMQLDDDLTVPTHSVHVKTPTKKKRRTARTKKSTLIVNWTLSFCIKLLKVIQTLFCFDTLKMQVCNDILFLLSDHDVI